MSRVGVGVLPALFKHRVCAKLVFFWKKSLSKGHFTAEFPHVVLKLSLWPPKKKSSAGDKCSQSSLIVKSCWKVAATLLLKLPE
jgi:hypothetical protein